MRVFAEELTPEELERHQLRCLLKTQLRRESKERNGEDRATCTICECDLTKAQTCLVQIVPHSKGGQLETDNVIICCSSCAMSKYGRTLQEWTERLNDQLDGAHALVTKLARKEESAA